MKTKKALQRSIAFLLAAVMILQVSVVAKAGETDSGITGISVNDTYYYVRNSLGKYLTCSSTGSLSLINVPSGVKAKFKVIKNNGNYYLQSSQGYYVKVNASTVNTSKTMNANARIKLSRVSGKYYIKGVNSGKYLNKTLSVSTSGVVWGFETVNKGTASIYNTEDAFSLENDIDNKFAINIFKTIVGYINDIGYTAKNRQDYSSKSAYSALQSDSLFFFVGHGSHSEGGYIALGKNANGETTYLNAYRGTNDNKYFYVASMPQNALAQSKCVVYMGCYTGNGELLNNLVYRTYQKGAHCVIGTNKEIWPRAAELWTKDFTYYADFYPNATIQECIDYACSRSEAKFVLRKREIRKEDLVIYGDTGARVNY